MAEIEFSVFSRQRLNRRIPNAATLQHEVAALEVDRNAARATIQWRFTGQDARRKFPQVYPSTSD